LHCSNTYTPMVAHAGEFSVAMTTADGVSNFTRGDNVTLVCYVTGDVTDDIHVTWSKDGDVVVVDGDRSTVTEDGQLTLYDVTSDDSGEYGCHATRWQQRADASFAITVHGRPPAVSHCRAPAHCLNAAADYEINM